MPSLVKFSDGSSHFYLPDGTPRHELDLRGARKVGAYPSVTTIDKAVFVNPALDKYKQEQIVIAALKNPRQPHETEETYCQRIYEASLEHSKTAADFGQKVHGCIDLHPTPPSEPELLAWFSQFDQWWTAEGLQSVGSEVVVVDHDIGVAGRMDRRAIHPEYGRVVLDYKTQGVKKDASGKKRAGFYESWKRQLAFYAVCDAKETGTFPKIPRCCSVVIDSTEACPPFIKWWAEDEIKFAYRQFVIGVWQWCVSKSPPYWPTGKPIDINLSIQLP